MMPRPIVANNISMTRTRLVPAGGDITVKLNQIVKSTDVVARAMIPGGVVSIGASAILGVSRSLLTNYLLVKEGQEVKKGEVIAKSSLLLGLIKQVITAPINGIIESISNVSGHILLRECSKSIEVKAFMGGKIHHADLKQGVTIESKASIVQGIFGVGKEVYGKLICANDKEEMLLTDNLVKSEFKDAIIFTKGNITTDAMEKMRKMGVSGIIAGSVNGLDLSKYIGRTINLASTGDEDIGFTLVVTEGFGELYMALEVLDILKKLEGSKVSLSGATQVRAGVIRPELIGLAIKEKEENSLLKNNYKITIGSNVRIIRGKLFGKTGIISDIPDKPAKIGSGSKALVYILRLDDKTAVSVPRCNVEI